MREVKTSSYDHDESQYVLDFLSKKKTLDEKEGNIDEIITESELEEFLDKYNLTTDKELSKVEERILYYLSGHTIFSVIKKKFKTCSHCLPLAMLELNDYNLEIAKYQKLRDYNGDALIQCDQKLFNEFFLPAETLFRKFVADDIVKKKGLVESLLKIFFKDKKEFFPCHTLDHVLAKRFFQIRLNINAREINRKNTEKKHGAENSSRTVKMRDMAKKHKLQPKKKAKQSTQKIKKIKQVQKKKEKASTSKKQLAKNAPEASTSIKQSVKNAPKNNKPTHYSQLDPNTMYAKDMQHELRLRGLSDKGKKEVLKIRLELRLVTEKNVEQKKSSGKAKN